MDWLERMNRAMNYLEKNMTGEINYNEAAKQALCSSYHFQRMFSFITHIPIGEYIRRRRLTLAAHEPGILLKAYPRISFYLTLKGNQKLEYRIVERESFKVFGISMVSTPENNTGNEDTKAFLEK